MQIKNILILIQSNYFDFPSSFSSIHPHSCNFFTTFLMLNDNKKPFLIGYFFLLDFSENLIYFSCEHEKDCQVHNANVDDIIINVPRGQSIYMLRAFWMVVLILSVWLSVCLSCFWQDNLFSCPALNFSVSPTKNALY